MIQHNRVLALTGQASGAWRVETEQGEVVAEHVVNAAGLWARRVGAMVGVDHRSCPCHTYLVTAEVPQVAAIEGDMPAVTDLEGFTYLQKEGRGVLLGVYERNPRHWKVEGADWDFGRTLFPEARPHHARALDRLPALPRARGHRHPPMGEPPSRSRRTATRSSAPWKASRTTGRHAGAWPDSRSAPASASPSRTGSSTATPATTCSAWTSRASAPSPRTTATCARRRRSSTRDASSWPIRTRSCRPAGP